ncbi:hypothetical protein IMCC3135_31480 [Granulosicoccus antarcticus IMCC3135]|uniref:Uncharacterized protein n=1 Tax=Granulosicoccus antarcticus IMCC3135 TaxID=1192854 RepID=A0A2Z2P8X8_9GAMM|nr:hypothetical protein IMCC3135_31480 [Granulosicoccus antarcticus IMCC3135]
MPQIPIKYCIYKQLLEDVLLLSNQENLRARRKRGSASSDRDRGRPKTGPSHTTRHAGPHRAVREVEVMRDEVHLSHRSI